MDLVVFVRLTVRPSVRSAKSQKAQQFCLILCMMLESYKVRKVTKHDFLKKRPDEARKSAKNEVLVF